MTPDPLAPAASATASGFDGPPLSFTLNGRPVAWPPPGDASLLDLLQADVGLRGTRRGCDAGHCGACTVLLDDRRVNACLLLAAVVEGRRVTTIEGLAGDGDALHPMQQAFVACDALQCGFCTPGQILSAIGLLTEAAGNPLPDVREGMSGNLCRCGAYPMIEAAIVQVQRLTGPDPHPEGALRAAGAP